MWPWDGFERPSDPVTITIGTIFLPPNPGPGDGLDSNPQVGETLDYLDLSGDGGNQNVCYDDIKPGVGDVPSFWQNP